MRLETFYRGRQVFLSGATSGIGLEMFRLLDQAGAKVFITGRNEAVLRSLVDGKPHRARAADLARPEAVEELAAWLEEEAAALDLAIHNAGLGYLKPIAGESDGTVDEVIAVNLRAPIQLTRRLWRLLEASSEPHLAFVSSVASTFPGAGYPVYAATKAGLSHFARSVAAEQERVRITWIEPGPTTTDFHRRAGMSFTPAQRLAFADARDCAGYALSAIARGRRRAVHTAVMKLVVALCTFAPGLAMAAGRRRGRKRGH